MSYKKISSISKNCILATSDSEELLSLDDMVCSEQPLRDKNKILAYISNLDFVRDAGLGFREKDMITGKKIPISGDVFGDGTYIWSDILIHYLKDHDIVLPTSFLAHIRQSNVYREADGFSSAPSMTDADTGISFEMFPKRMRLAERIEILPMCPDREALRVELIRRGYSEEEIVENLPYSNKR